MASAEVECFTVEDIVGIYEIGERLGLRPDSLAALRGKGGMPPERAKIGARVPWWSWSQDIVPWAISRRYLTMVVSSGGEQEASNGA
jgi:hypothetical protein